MSLLCYRSTPIDHVIPSPEAVQQSSHKRHKQNARKEGIQESLLHRQLLQKKQHDHANDLSNFNTGQLTRLQEQDTRKWTPAIVRQACTEPRSYIIEIPTGQVLRRNRRHLKEDVSNSNKTDVSP